MMALESFSENPSDSDFLILNACHTEMAYFFNKAGQKTELIDWLKTREFPILKNQGPHDTIKVRLDAHLYFRELDISEAEASQATHAFGKYGILFEGDSGIGKSTTLRLVLEERRFSQDEEDPQKRYCILTLNSANATEVRARLLSAAKNGEIVILEEMNTNPGMIEDILTEIMSSGGIGTSIPLHPGFRIFVTQNNSGEMSNRQSLPESLLSRFQCIDLPELTQPDFEVIVDSEKTMLPIHSERLFHAFMELKGKHDITPRLVQSFVKTPGL
jgi:hypothetical protein